ncbi:hypothetical protein [Entomobacter blattae]|uniref:hypothetical protein n=1 Tax=Entomobacter blattae TaxID=2762277 RepID=UPI00193C6085|nr:hypothetical protein [Entomobacter blattae]
MVTSFKVQPLLLAKPLLLLLVAIGRGIGAIIEAILHVIIHLGTLAFIDFQDIANILQFCTLLGQHFRS